MLVKCVIRHAQRFLLFFKNQFNSTFRNEIVFLLGIFLSSFFIIRVPDIRERIQYRTEKKLRE